MKNIKNLCLSTFEEAERTIEDFHQQHPRSKKRFNISTLYMITESVVPKKVTDTIKTLDELLEELGFSKADKIALCYAYLENIEVYLQGKLDNICTKILDKNKGEIK